MFGLVWYILFRAAVRGVPVMVTLLVHTFPAYFLPASLFFWSLSFLFVFFLTLLDTPNG